MQSFCLIIINQPYTASYYWETELLNDWQELVLIEFKI